MNQYKSDVPGHLRTNWIKDIFIRHIIIYQYIEGVEIRCDWDLMWYSMMFLFCFRIINVHDPKGITEWSPHNYCDVFFVSTREQYSREGILVIGISTLEDGTDVGEDRSVMHSSLLMMGWNSLIDNYCLENELSLSITTYLASSNISDLV